jgi:hypothetical protein
LGLVWRYSHGIIEIKELFQRDKETINLLNSKFIFSVVIKVAFLIIPASIFLVTKIYEAKLGGIGTMLLEFGLPAFLAGFILFCGFEILLIKRIYRDELVIN